MFSFLITVNFSFICFLLSFIMCSYIQSVFSYLINFCIFVCYIFIYAWSLQFSLSLILFHSVLLYRLLYVYVLFHFSCIRFCFLFASSPQFCLILFSFDLFSYFYFTFFIFIRFICRCLFYFNIFGDILSNSLLIFS